MDQVQYLCGFPAFCVFVTDGNKGTDHRSNTRFRHKGQQTSGRSVAVRNLTAGQRHSSQLGTLLDPIDFLRNTTQLVLARSLHAPSGRCRSVVLRNMKLPRTLMGGCLTGRGCVPPTPLDSLEALMSTYSFYLALSLIHDDPSLEMYPVSSSLAPSWALRAGEGGTLLKHADTFIVDPDHITTAEIAGRWGVRPIPQVLPHRETLLPVRAHTKGGSPIVDGFPVEDVVESVAHDGDDVLIVVPPWSSRARCVGLWQSLGLFVEPTFVEMERLLTFADSVPWDTLFISVQQWESLGVEDRQHLRNGGVVISMDIERPSPK